MRAFFYDTWAFAALANSADPAHEIAVDIDRNLDASGYVAVTSDYILDETLTLLNVAAGSRVATLFLDGFLARVAGGDVQLLEVGTSRRGRAIDIFRKLAPAERRLSFTDATSFSLMKEFSIRAAFTADRHFHRAGSGIVPLVELRAGRFKAVPLP